MNVKQLIEQLQKLDPEKEVFIEHCEEFDYMQAESVRELELVDMINQSDETLNAVVIQYT